MKRRDFVVATAAGAMASGAAKTLPKRPYKDGVELSIIGYGGIVIVGMDEKAGAKSVAASVDRGVNYFDVAPSYFNGEAEIKLGAALAPYRKNVFLAEKTGKRDAAGAQAELEQSLKRLRTDHFDLYQFHAVGSMEDAEKILAPGGAAETFLRAKKEGKVRFIGFSAHHPGAALKLMDALPLDSVLFPVNFAAWEVGGFGPQILEKAKSKGMARLALKALALGQWPKDMKREQRPYPKCWYQPLDDRELAALALRFTLTKEITAAVPPGDERIYEMALDLAGGSLPPLTAKEHGALVAKAKQVEPVFRA